MTVLRGVITSKSRTTSLRTTMVVLIFCSKAGGQAVFGMSRRLVIVSVAILPWKRDRQGFYVCDVGDGVQRCSRTPPLL